MTDLPGYTSPAVTVALPPSAHSSFNAASSWAFQNRDDQMLRYVDKLDREETLHSWRAAQRLVAALAERHSVLVDQLVDEVADPVQPLFDRFAEARERKRG